MKINGKSYRTIWISPEDQKIVQTIDQRYLPHKFVVEALHNVEDVAIAISDMHVRGAGLIGVIAAYGIYLAALQAPKQSAEAFMDFISASQKRLQATRPTAVNLEWALNKATQVVAEAQGVENKTIAAQRLAETMADEAAEECRKIGEYGFTIIEEISRRKKGEVVNILTHCNAGWLAFVDYGTATAPIYEAQARGIKVHVYVDETRPRNQGGQLTAFELGQNGVPHTIIADNTGGHLMQHGMVDIVIVGSDRTTYTGDVANKIGTYLKAIAAHENQVPFYVALPSSTIDWQIRDGVKEIPIEKRDEKEIKYITGLNEKGGLETVLITPKDSPAANYGFDVTPSRYITALITEKGVCPASEEGIKKLFPDQGRHS